MNGENNNLDVNFEEKNDNITVSDDVVVPGNIINDDNDSIENEDFSGPIIVSNDDSEDEEITGPIIVSNDEAEESEEISGPIIVNSEEDEKIAVEKINNEKLAATFKNLEEEIKKLNDEKEEVESNIQNLSKRKEELEILIKNKQEELDYKKEVEVTTDRLKTYIKDLEVKPGAVRDALAALINNMDN